MKGLLVAATALSASRRDRLAPHVLVRINEFQAVKLFILQQVSIPHVYVFSSVTKFRTSSNDACL